MKNINQFRSLIILFVVAASVFVIYSMPINLGLDLQGGTRLVFVGQSTEKVEVNDDSMDGVVAVIRNRIDSVGVSEPVIQRKGKDQVIVELPGVKDPDRAIKIIGDTALLEFIEAEWAPAGGDVLTPEKVKEYYGSSARLGSVDHTENGKVVSSQPIILKDTAITGSDLKAVYPQVDEYGNPSVGFELNSEGASVFARLTTRHVKKPIAILLDKKIISAPNVNTPITEGKGIITGNFSAEEVRDMVVKLKAGSLPIPIKIGETRIVGPTLGRDSIEKSRFAGIIGFLFIVLFMVFYYRLPGFIAILSLIIYIFVTLALLSLIRTTLTLPGIAGFLLSLGMAVDANIIIFERLKEELRSGKKIKSALDASFDRALSTIVDSNVTTIVAAATLFFIGTGTIKGFAVTLSVGILASMFTAITLTKMMLNMLIDSGVVSDPNTKLVYK
ncbi:protein-export membrane protein SecD [candidate division WOR-1 bacterium RIFOXYD2_FULL_36_8]|uniref:Protein translocase subunit SecD n=1 Tax=candidate division WOR-1 bacterium RIFOXYB2_FULL_36_35 TaxID=1802578 RepID=A0A1F4S8S3_UNCSA|nr:MAG: protein-export membrane protein SecD [candidate division WOR-1 bacterium RIFOXYA2_FULL_36_21]OGC16809.1 MAG: protein-export membrane protein SecD [candidate division WOR-1 bacterium RIFOXYB2_FULL_36_35]OGC19824.1 MAG: protein-export membrane protein SecD [candidate division WOR-1 bacterium RIFOXYA12_FULL_36_13]OGC37314.1 MAG: protein-export membrane protein SecD [candidate division WOR-1 bacterium RIFOXYD2_FULL_36_8]